MTTTYPPELTALLDREPLPSGGTTGTTVDYQAGDTACRGYLATPGADQSGSLCPGVLVLPDWLGMSPYARMRSDMIARLGYISLTADIYGGGALLAMDEAPPTAGRFMGDRALWLTRLTAAHQTLARTPGVDPTRIAVLGYCFGGLGGLLLARTGIDLAGVVSIHAGLETGPTGEAAKIKARLLILSGASDPHVPDAAITALSEELRAAPSVDWEITLYSGAMHAFSIPGVNSPEFGAMYDAGAERRSWSATREFFSEIFASS